MRKVKLIFRTNNRSKGKLKTTRFIENLLTRETTPKTKFLTSS